MEKSGGEPWVGDGAESEVSTKMHALSMTFRTDPGGERRELAEQSREWSRKMRENIETVPCTKERLRNNFVTVSLQGESEIVY